MLNKIVGCLGVMAAFLAGTAAHAGCSFSYTFSSGTTIDSGQVNQNFTDLSNCTGPLNGLLLTKDNSGYGGGQLLITGATNTNKQTWLGFNTTNNVGVLQAYLQGTGPEPFALQPNGGSVGIGTITPNYKLSISANVSHLPSFAPPGAVAQLASTDGTNTRSLLDSFGAVPLLDFRRADTSAAAPSALQSGDILGQLSWWGYGATGYSSSARASLRVVANENWTDTAQSTYMTFQTTPAGSAGPLERVRIDNAGSLGIGTTTPDAPLTVGSSSVSGNVAHFQNSAGSCYINPTTTSLSCSSDARLKANVKALNADAAMNAINALRPVSYNWQAEAPGTRAHAGFLAQEVEKILPDLVSQAADGYYTLNYAGFTPYLTEAIRQQQNQIDELRSLVQQVVLANAKLQKKIAKISAGVSGGVQRAAWMDEHEGGKP